MRWVVYILRCGDGSLYTGVTTDLQARMRMHRSGKGSAYVRQRRVGRIVHTERYRTRSRAQQREWEIKHWTRQVKLAFLAKPHA